MPAMRRATTTLRGAPDFRPLFTRMLFMRSLYQIPGVEIFVGCQDVLSRKKMPWTLRQKWVKLQKKTAKTLDKIHTL
jgi:hypothetical protein